MRGHCAKRAGDCIGRRTGLRESASNVELDRALHVRGVARRPFALHAARATPFVTDRPQELYLVSSSLAALGARLADGARDQGARKIS